jgi:hypothetical protein
MSDVNKIIKEMLANSINPSDLNHLYQVKKYLDNTVKSIPLTSSEEVSKHLLNNILSLRDSLQNLILENEVKLKTLQLLAEKTAKSKENKNKKKEDLNAKKQENQLENDQTS